MFLLSTLLGSSPALGAGGAVAGPIGEDPPVSSGTQLTIAPGADNNTLVLTVEISGSVDDLAVLWPAAGLVPTSVVKVDPRWFERIEAVTRPRVEELTCTELVELTHWRTPPGCSSYEAPAPELTLGEEAISSVPAALSWADVGLQLEVITGAELPDWLALRELALDPEMALVLQPHLDAGEPILTIRPDRPVTGGTWLPPVRFAVAPGEVVLPLTIGAAAASTRHELHVYGLADPELPNPTVANYPAGLVPDECVLERGTDATAWLEASREALEEASALVPFVLEYADRADRCDPCVEEPLDGFELATLGLGRPPDDARVSRIRMAWAPGALDRDPVIAFAGPPPSKVDLHFLANDPDLLFAFPLCGEEAPGGGGTCPNLHLPGSGCRTAGPVSLAVVWLAAIGLRRRRLGPLVLLFACLLPGAVRAAPPDPGPRTELHAALAVFGTDRVVPTGLAHGAPWLGNPFVGAEIRRSVLALRNGTNIGWMAGVRGWAGRAAPWSARGVTTFWLVEPELGVDIRHGRFREGNPSGRFRYGFLLTLTGLAPSVSPAQFVPSGALHAGYGWWLGRGLERTSVELRASVIPRTDGFETRYHPNVGLPGHMFYPGTANLWVVVGRAWY